MGRKVSEFWRNKPKKLEMSLSICRPWIVLSHESSVLPYLFENVGGNIRTEVDCLRFIQVDANDTSLLDYTSYLRNLEWLKKKTPWVILCPTSLT